ERSSVVPGGVVPAGKDPKSPEPLPLTGRGVTWVRPGSWFIGSGMASDLLHGLANEFKRHVAGDLYLSDPERKNEVHGSTYRLFVRHQAADSLLGSAAHRRERTKLVDGRDNLFFRFRSAETAIARNGRGGNHAPTHSLAVKKVRVAGSCFQCVANRVAIV